LLNYGDKPAQNILTAFQGNSQFTNAVKFKGGTYPGIGGTCGATISGSPCTVVIEHNQTISGAIVGTLNLEFFNGVEAVTEQISISAFAADAAQIMPAASSLTSGAFSFGSALTNVAQTLSVQLENASLTRASGISAVINNTTANTSAVFGFAGGQYPGVGGTCGQILNQGACTVVLSAQASAPGNASGVLQMAYFDGLSIQNLLIPINATFQSAANIQASALNLNFGNVVTNLVSTASVTLTNIGTVSGSLISASGSISAPFAWAGGSFPGSGGTCTSVLAANNSCTLNFEIQPTVSGILNSTALISYYSGLSNQSISINLSANAQEGAVITAPNLNFGSVAISSQKDLNLNINVSGTTTTSVSSISGLPANVNYVGGTFPGVGGTCTTPLNNGTCSINLRYVPTVTAILSATASINYIVNSVAKLASFTLAGVAGAPSQILLPGVSSSMSFGDVAVGNSSLERIVTLGRVLI
jgi:hypothetical protein